MKIKVTEAFLTRNFQAGGQWLSIYNVPKARKSPLFRMLEFILQANGKGYHTEII